MALSNGMRLGPYEILSPLGAGGMGEVYRARDTRLERTVAIKILPDHLSSDPTRRRRFDLEARSISKLNDPHICTLHDVGHQDGIDYLVMEFLEGETLQQRLSRGPTSIAEAVRIGKEIAGALDKAHRQGIVHRDLKPGNITLTKSGAKLMDFGLAKVMSQVPVGVSSATTLADQTSVTREGAVVGTTHYLSPEQIAGLEADERSDIFAFGCVLYEMLSGRQAFHGDSEVAVIGAIMERDPEPLALLRPAIPPALEHVVNRCLAKEPNERWQSMRDVEWELAWASTGSHTLALPMPVKSRARFWGLFAAGSAVVAGVLSGILGWKIWSDQYAENIPTLRTTVALSPWGLHLTGEGLAISPDGQTLVFAAQGEGEAQLYLRRLDEWEPRALSGTERAYMPFFSPDGEWVAFSVIGKGIQKVSIRGGSPQALFPPGSVAANTEIRNGVWTSDGEIIFGTVISPMGDGLWMVPAAGGTPRLIAKAEKPATYQDPEILPGNRTVVFTVVKAGRSSIAAADLKSGTVRTIVDSGAMPHYLAPGYLVYAFKNDLYTAPFDAEQAVATGQPRLISGRASDANYGLSANGTLVYAAAANTLGRLVWKDRNGATTPLKFERRNYGNPRLSADGKHFAVSIDDGVSQSVWIGTVSGEPLTRLTFGDQDSAPIFAPNGKWVLFTSARNGSWNVYRVAVDGSGTVEQLTDTPHPKLPTSVLPQGDAFFFNDVSDSGLDILFRDPTGTIRPFLKTQFNELQAKLSPDGKWVAYTSDESGIWEVYVRPYSGPGKKVQVSIGGGQGTAWNPKGGELFYQGPSDVMSVQMRGGTPLGPPRPVFPRGRTAGQGSDWTATADGSRFLVKDSPDAGPPAELNVITNWGKEVQTGALATKATGK